MHIFLTLVGVGIAWLLLALAIGYLERGHTQAQGDAEDHNGD
jgi:hypothetical protein